MQGFIIHLDRAKDRRAHVDHLISALPFPTRAWPACDGAALPAADLNGMRTKETLFRPKFPFAMSVGEVACFESHRAVWRHILAENLPAAMVFEDDVTIDPQPFAAAAEMAERHVQTHGYIQFQTRPVPPVAVTVHQEDGLRLAQPTVVPLRASAQMISQDAARKLLAVADKIDRPVDVLVQMFWETGVRPVCVTPSGVSDLPGPTTIQSKRSPLQKLVAELRRPIFRRQMRRLSKRHA